MAHKIATLILLLSLFAIACNNTQPTPPQDEEKEFWAWSHPRGNYSDHQWDSVLSKMQEAGFTGILIGADTAVLQRIIPMAKQKNIEVHAWMWAMNRFDADSSWLSYNAQDSSLAEKQAYVGYYKFMCPALPEVKEFLKKKVSDLAKIEGLDGIHLDYIRYVDVILPTNLQPKYKLKQDSIMEEFDYGYHPYMRQLYKDKYGVDPKELPNFKNDTSWINFRLRELNKTVNSLVPVAHQGGTQITAAVFPSPKMSRNMVRQDWEHWDLDRFFPMVYYGFYNQDYQWASSIMDTNRIAVGDSNVICGFYLSDEKDSTGFSNAVHHILDNGAKGISIFELGGLKDYHYKVIKNYSTK